jgi:GTP-binding protein
MQLTTATFIKSSPDYNQCPKGDKPEFAFTGRSNVGKSSLINYLTGRKKLAKTSSTPGKTRLINHFLINKSWYLVDLPGYGYAKVSKGQRQKFRQSVQEYILYRQNLLSLFVLIDSRHKPLKNDLDFMEWLGENAIPFAIVFTKTDKLNEEQQSSNLDIYKNELLKSWQELPPVFMTSAMLKSGGKEIIDYIQSINHHFPA